MTAANSELSMDFTRVFRKFDLGAETAVCGDYLFGGLCCRPLMIPSMFECAWISVCPREGLSLVISAFQMILYRNSYQAEFDLALVDLRDCYPNIGSLVWLSSFNADSYALTTRNISKFDSQMSQGSMEYACDSDVLVFLANTNQLVTDHEFLKKHIPILALVVKQEGADISLSWLYRENIIVDKVLDNLERQMSVLIDGMFAQPDRRLIELKVASETMDAQNFKADSLCVDEMAKIDAQRREEGITDI